MRFLIKRTSGWGGDTPPVPDATKGTAPVWDRRTFKSPEEHDAKFGYRDKWLERGTEHGYWEEDGQSGIKRRFDDHLAWFVEISTLDELIAFQKTHGDLVLSGDDGTPSIEIYDDYRE